MKLSLRTMELCRRKYGKGFFWGFEEEKESILENLSQEAANEDFFELLENGLLALEEGDIHISALGQNIFKMMTEPEQYCMLANPAEDLCVRIYIRNTYYLCVIEDKKILAEDSCDRYKLELLPDLKLVVGAFSYALHPEGQGQQKSGNDIHIVGNAWDKNGSLISELVLDGEQKSGTSELINKLTLWLFEMISAFQKAKEEENGRD